MFAIHYTTDDGLEEFIGPFPGSAGPNRWALNRAYELVETFDGGTVIPGSRRVEITRDRDVHVYRTWETVELLSPDTHRHRP